MLKPKATPRATGKAGFSRKQPGYYIKERGPPGQEREKHSKPCGPFHLRIINYVNESSQVIALIKKV